MRVLLSCFMLTAAFSLNASEESSVDKEVVIREVVSNDADLRTIFQEGIQKNDRFQAFIHFIAGYFLNELDINGSPYRLVSAFNEEIKKPEWEAQYFDIIRTYVDAEEEVAKLLQSENYKAYQQPLSDITADCLEIAKNILKALLANSDIEHAERLNVDRNYPEEYLRIIFEQVFLNNPFLEEQLHEIVREILEEQDSVFSEQELVAKLQEALKNREFEEEFLSITCNYFSVDEIEKVAEFVQNPIYSKFHYTYASLSVSCLQLSAIVFAELLSSTEVMEQIFANDCQFLIKTLCEDNFDAMMSSDKPVIVLIDNNERDYEVEEFNKNYGDMYDIYHLNVDEQGREFASRFTGFGSFSMEITEEGLVRTTSSYTLPTFIFIDHGKEVGAHEGSASMDRLLEQATEFFGSF